MLVLATVACLPFAAPSPSPSPTPAAAAPLRVLVGDAPDSSIAARARLLGLAGAQVELVARPGRRGSIAVAELVRQHAGDARALAAVGAAILAGEILEDAKPRLAETVPVARLPTDPLVVAVAPASPVSDARDLRRRLERDASALRFAGGPQATLGHLLAAAIVRDAAHGAAGLVYAAHGSPQDAIAAVAGDQSQIVVAPYGAARAALAEGKIRGLAVSSATRIEGTEIPTLRESGIDVALTDWVLVVAAPGIDAAALAALRDLAQRAHAQPAWREALRQSGWVEDFATEGLTTFLGTELTRTLALLRHLALIK